MMGNTLVLFIESKCNNSCDLFSNYLCGELRKNWLIVFETWGRCVRSSTTWHNVAVLRICLHGSFLNPCSHYKATCCHMRISLIYILTRYFKIRKGEVVVRTYMVELLMYETCMYVCTYVRMYVYMYVCTYVCTYVVCMYVRM
jgi:hypothetical protein